MSAKKTVPAWIPCPHCESFWCTLHGVHVYDCPCPPIEEWDIDPYSDSLPFAGGLPHTQPETRTMNATEINRLDVWKLAQRDIELSNRLTGLSWVDSYGNRVLYDLADQAEVDTIVAERSLISLRYQTDETVQVGEGDA